MIKFFGFLFLVVLQTFGCSQTKQGWSPKAAQNIVDLTKDELPVYIVLNARKGEEKMGRILLTNFQLQWDFFQDMEIQGPFLDTLRAKLVAGEIDIPQGVKLSPSYQVDKQLLKKVRKLSVKDTYDKYFTPEGIPKENIAEEEIKAAVSHLIEKGTIVHGGQYADYNIFVLPE